MPQTVGCEPLRKDNPLSQFQAHTIIAAIDLRAHHVNFEDDPRDASLNPCNKGLLVKFQQIYQTFEGSFSLHLQCEILVGQLSACLIVISGTGYTMFKIVRDQPFCYQLVCNGGLIT